MEESGGAMPMAHWGVDDGVVQVAELGSTLVPDGDLGCSEHGMSMVWDLDTTPRPQTIATKSRVLQYLGLKVMLTR